MIHKERILVVDDEPHILELFAEVFGAAGYNVVTASNGTEALEKFEPGRFDCIVSDLAMPGMDGLELLKQIKSRDRKVIFLMITGYPSIESAVEAMKFGAYDYLTKPFNIEDLRIKVERALYTRSLESSLRTARRRMKGLIILVPVLTIIAIVIGMFLKR